MSDRTPTEQRSVAYFSMEIAINGSFFNTQRMMQQYVLNAYYAR